MFSTEQPQPDSSFCKKSSQEELVPACTTSIRELLNHRPVDWPSVLVELRRDRQGDVRVHAPTLLHLACSFDDPQTRIPSMALMTELCSAIEPSVLYRAVNSVNVIKSDGRTALHRACVFLPSTHVDDQDRPMMHSISDESDQGGGDSSEDENLKVQNDLCTNTTKDYSLTNDEICSEVVKYCDIGKYLISLTAGAVLPDDEMAVLFQDKRGHTPLHVAVGWKSTDNGDLSPCTVIADETARLGLVMALVEKAKLRGGLLIQDRRGNTPLHQAVIDRAARGVTVGTTIEEYIAAACPDAIQYANDQGMTPLLCIAKGRLSVATDEHENDAALLGADERAWNLLAALGEMRPQAFSIRDHSLGYTPLHFICQNDVSPALVELLQKAETQGIKNLTVKDAKEQLVRAAVVQDRKGMTPLHLACLDRASNSVVQMLLESSPEASVIRDNNGYTPLYRAWQSHVTCVQMFYSALVQAEIPASLLVGISGEMFDKLAMLIRAAYHGSISGPSFDRKKWRMIHACAGTDCPSPILQLALKVTPEQVFERDENGDLPLHIACSSQAGLHDPPIPPSAEPAAEDDHNDGGGHSKPTGEAPPKQFSWSLIDALLNADFSTALISNREGRLPLHLAIESKKTWDHGIKSILSAAPQAISRKDAKTKLYPFMLAATVGSTTEQAENATAQAQEDVRLAEKAADIAEKAAESAEDIAQAAQNKGVTSRRAADADAAEAWKRLGQVFATLELAQNYLKKKIEEEKLEVLLLENVYKLLQLHPELVQRDRN